MHKEHKTLTNSPGSTMIIDTFMNFFKIKLNVKAGACMQPSCQPIQGWVADDSMLKAQELGGWGFETQWPTGISFSEAGRGLSFSLWLKASIAGLIQSCLYPITPQPLDFYYMDGIEGG